MPRRTPIELIYIGKAKTRQIKRKIPKQKIKVRSRRYTSKAITNDQINTLIQINKQLTNANTRIKPIFQQRLLQLESILIRYRQVERQMNEYRTRGLNAPPSEQKVQLISEASRLNNQLQRLDSDFQNIYNQLRIDALRYL